MKKIVILVYLLGFWGCKSSVCDHKIALFFNSSSLDETNYHFKASVGKLIIIDTLLKSTSIDESTLMKCFYEDKGNQLIISINGLRRVVKLDSLRGIKGPASVFTHYDKRIKLASIFQSYTRKSIRISGQEPMYKTFVDSLSRVNKVAGKYDSLMVYIKNDICWCGEK
jgi:hypothetical protein